MRLNRAGFNPLSPDINMHILLTVLHMLCYDTTWENLFKYQDITSLVIISVIFVTCMLDQSVILRNKILVTIEVLHGGHVACQEQ